jgi:hypothetical protein
MLAGLVQARNNNLLTSIILLPICRRSKYNKAANYLKEHLMFLLSSNSSK